MSKIGRIPGITNLPLSAPGMRIGLFGGSFNPPHPGHRLVSRQVMRKLQLDAVWWLVSPGNPLKDNSNLAPLETRVKAARDLVELPNVHITGFEAEHGFRYSYDTMKYLKQTLSDRKLVWIMGADNLANFHRWEHWQRIARLMPMAIYERPGSSRRAPFSRAAIRFARFRLDEAYAPLLPYQSPPAWVYLRGLVSELSSTAIRAKSATPQS